MATIILAHASLRFISLVGTRYYRIAKESQQLISTTLIFFVLFFCSFRFILLADFMYIMLCYSGCVVQKWVWTRWHSSQMLHYTASIHVLLIPCTCHAHCTLHIMIVLCNIENHVVRLGKTYRKINS